MSATNPDNRVMLKSLSEENTIPIVGWDSRNFWFLLGAIVLGYIVGKELPYGGVTNVLVPALVFLIALDIVRSVPPYTNVTDWIQSIFKYYRKPSKYSNVAEANLDTDSSLRSAVETPKSTREDTNVKRFYPPYGIVERTDGSLAAILEYNPPNMDFSTNAEYQRLMSTVAGWYNDNEIDFDISLHATTRPVDMETYFERLNDRLKDPDVRQNEIFEALLEEMKEDRRRMLKTSDAEVLHVYLIVDVYPKDVADVLGGDETARSRSLLFKLFARSDKDETQDVSEELVERRRMEKKLERRIQTVAGLLNGSPVLSDADIRRISTAEAAAVLESYWTGTRLTDLSSSDSEGVRPTDQFVLPPDSNQAAITTLGDRR